MDLKYDKYGKGYPILFLHGFNITPDNHVDYLKAVGEEYEVIAPYLTDIKPHCSSLQEYTDLTKTFIKHHKLDQYSTIGYSLGGGISFELADSGPVKPECMIGLAPLMPVHNSTLDFIVQGLKMCYNELTATNLNNYKEQFKMVNTIVGNCLSNPLEFYNSVSSFSHYSIDNLIFQPTQIVLGKNDEFFNSDTMLSDLYDHFFDLELIELLGVNHNILSDNHRIADLNIEYLNDMIGI